jgi:hypothetical protein
MNHEFTRFISNHYLIITDDDTKWTYRIYYDCDNDIYWVAFPKYSGIIGQQSRIDYLISNNIGCFSNIYLSSQHIIIDNIGSINNIHPSSSQHITIVLNPHTLLEII